MTDRDRRFADEYMIDYNAKAAAIRAGYSPATAKNAYAWIHPEHPTKPKLRELIDRKLAEKSRRTGVTAERLIRETAAIAFANMDDVIDWETGKIRDGAQRDDLAAVSAFRKKAGDSWDEIEVKIDDRLRARELLAKWLRLFDGAPTDASSAVVQAIVEAVKRIE